MPCGCCCQPRAAANRRRDISTDATLRKLYENIANNLQSSDLFTIRINGGNPEDHDSSMIQKLRNVHVENLFISNLSLSYDYLAVLRNLRFKPEGKVVLNNVCMNHMFGQVLNFVTSRYEIGKVSDSKVFFRSFADWMGMAIVVTKSVWLTNLEKSFFLHWKKSKLVRLCLLEAEGNQFCSADVRNLLRACSYVNSLKKIAYHTHYGTGTFIKPILQASENREEPCLRDIKFKMNDVNRKNTFVNCYGDDITFELMYLGGGIDNPSLLRKVLSLEDAVCTPAYDTMYRYSNTFIKDLYQKL